MAERRLFRYLLALLVVVPAATTLASSVRVPPLIELPAGAIAATLTPGTTDPHLIFGMDAGPQPAADAATEPTLAIRNRGTMQTASGFIATAPLNGLLDGSHVIVYGDGTIAANSAAGDVLWSHASFEFTQWTGRYPPYANGNAVPANPLVPFGFDPLDALRRVAAHPFAVADLTGDGVDDIAVAMFFYRVTAIEGNGGTYLFVLDGRTGSLLWSRGYPGFVTDMAIVNQTLVVASETGDFRSTEGIGQNGSVSTLDAWTFSTSGSALQGSQVWSLSTGAQWARWLAVERIAGGRVAAAWTNRESGSAATDFSHLLLVPVSSGIPAWNAVTSGYVRFLRPDASRGQVMSIEHGEPTTGFSYSIVARNLSDGAVTRTVTQTNATAVAFQVGDLEGDALAEWVVGDIQWPPCAGPLGCTPLVIGGRVIAFDGATGAQKWSQQRGNELPDPNDQTHNGVPRPAEVLIVPRAGGADVLVASFMPGARDTELELLSGALGLSGPAGTVLWSQRQMNLLHPLFVSLYQQNGQTFVRGASSRTKVYGYGIDYSFDSTGLGIPLRVTTPYQVIRAFNAATGAQVSAVPQMGRIHGAAGTKVNGDTKNDLVVGGESGAVFALDGNKIDDHPTLLWRRTVAGPVHQIEAADLDGDGRDEIIVAATSAVDVLDSRTGDLRYEIPYPANFIWEVTVTDVDGDGDIEIVVPAASLTVYNGRDGSVLWTYQPSGAQSINPLFSNAVLTPEHTVIVQFAYGLAANGFNRGVIALNGSTGSEIWSDSTVSSFPQLWHGTTAGTLNGVTGTVAGLTWMDQTGGITRIRVEIRNATAGAIINELPPPLEYGGNYGSFLAPDRGVIANAPNFSWLVNSTEAGRVLGADIPQQVTGATFGLLGRRVVEAMWPSHVRVYRQGGPDLTPGNANTNYAAFYSRRFALDGVHVRDLDGDGWDEIIRTPWDWDGFNMLVSTTQGIGYEQTLLSDGLDVLSVRTLTPPVARLSAPSTSGTVPLTVLFDASASTDPDPGDSIASFTMSFGDDTPDAIQTSPLFSHTYERPGLYTARLRVVDTDGLQSAADATLVIDVRVSVPGAPVIGVAVPGDARATISFTPPLSDGGSAITGYTVTCNPNGIAAGGTVSPIVVSGLSNGTTYNCSVTATNAIGTGAPSATATVTPAALPVINSVAVTSYCASTTSLTLTLIGTSFVNGSVVHVNGTARPTTSLSATRLNVTLNPTREITLRVINPGGLVSNDLTTTIQLPADVNGEGSIDAQDLVILANYLVENVTPGIAPFNAPLSVADVNGDGRVDAVDIVVMANHLVGNIDCLRGPTSP